MIHSIHPLRAWSTQTDGRIQFEHGADLPQPFKVKNNFIKNLTFARVS